MNDSKNANMKMIEELYERATEYGKTSFELEKLKIVDKSTSAASSFSLKTIVFVLIVLFMLIFSMGLAFWLGDFFGNTSYGFFAVAAFYGLIIIILRFILYKWIKKLISDCYIKQILN